MQQDPIAIKRNKHNKMDETQKTMMSKKPDKKDSMFIKF